MRSSSNRKPAGKARPPPGEGCNPLPISNQRLAVADRGKRGGVRQLWRRTFHALRHSFTSALANSGVAPGLRMKLTGHKSEAMHRGYSHHETETLAKAIAKMPGLK